MTVFKIAIGKQFSEVIYFGKKQFKSLIATLEGGKK